MIGADGPRSFLRTLVVPRAPRDLRFAGYAAWRGTVAEVDMPQDTRDMLRHQYTDLSNCLYFIHGRTKGSVQEHAVLYDIGKGLINWLVYENRDTPMAEAGRTTTAVSQAEVEEFIKRARDCWGDALGAVIEATPSPFVTDVYDLV